MIVAAIGILINGATALLFMSGKESDLNIRAASMHMAADAGISAGVVVAALVIGVTGFLWIDPTASLVIVAIVMMGTWSLLRDSANLAMQAVPPGTDATGIQDYLSKLPGVTEVHDLHIWALSTTDAALTLHLVIPNSIVDDEFLCRVIQELHDEFAIEHVTIQIESGDPANPCPLAPADVV